MPTNPDQRLRDQRRLRGYSQQALAEKLGVGRTTINRIERGTQVPSLELALRIAEALGATVDMLWGSEHDLETAEAGYQRGYERGFDKGYDEASDDLWEEVEAARAETRRDDPHGIAAHVAEVAPKPRAKDGYAVWLLRSPGGAKHDAVVAVWVYRRKPEEADDLYELKTGKPPGRRPEPH